MAGMSKLKRDLIAMNNAKNANHQVAPMVRASKQAAKNTTATVSKGNTKVKSGGRTAYGKITPTGGANSPVKATPVVRPKSSGAVYYKVHPTGNAAPQGKGGITGSIKRQLMG